MEHLVCEDQQDPLAPRFVPHVCGYAYEVLLSLHGTHCRESKGLLDQLDRLELQVLM